MFQKILVPLDGSKLAECVLPHVVALSQDENIQVILLRVLDPVRESERLGPVDPLDWQIYKAEADAYLREVSARLDGAGIRVSFEVSEGRAAERVVELAHSQAIDLILLSSHGQSGLSGWNVSSIVQKIIQRVRTSIMIVRAYRPEPEGLGDLRYRKILVPLDGSQRAEIALPAANYIAGKHEAELIVAQVVRKPEIPRHTPPSPEDIELAERLTERNRLEAMKYLEELGSRLDARLQTRLLVEESVTRTLHRLSEEEGVDLVLMGAHGYTGETRWPYGSVVVGFIVYGEVPLLIIQDLPIGSYEPTRAELAASSQRGR